MQITSYIHYNVKDNGRYKSKAVYTVLAVNLEGKKEVLGLYLSVRIPAIPITHSG